MSVRSSQSRKYDDSWKKFSKGFGINQAVNLKYKYSIEELEEFIFPRNLQYPLSTGRMYAFAICGPLDESNNLRSGLKGYNIVKEYELDEMCQQYEREDLIRIYLHRERDFGTLSLSAQDMIINQADGHLKTARGKGYLPSVTHSDILTILSGVNRDENNQFDFHDIQKAIMTFREERIQKFKLVYPQLAIKSSAQDTLAVSQQKLKLSKTLSNRRENFKKTVSSVVAPPEMFQHMTGLRNADIADQTIEYLNRHAFKISHLDQLNNPAICSNVRIIRETKPKFPDPYRNKDGSRLKSEWSSTSNVARSGLGSLVSAAPSSSTWKHKYTLY